jgi:hypothetical protein
MAWKIFVLAYCKGGSRDSVVGIATGYGLEEEGSEFESR